MVFLLLSWSFPGGIVVKNPFAKEGDTGLILGLGGSPAGKSGYPLQYSCLKNPTGRGRLQSMGLQRVRHD